MPATMATVSGILKEVYEPRISDQLDNETVGLKRIEKTAEGVSENLGGRYTTFAIHTKRNSGIGSRQENEALPVAGQQGHAAATVKLKYAYGSAGMTGQTLKLVNTNLQAFTSALDSEMTGLKNDVAKDQNRQVYATGNGAIGVVTAIVTAVIIPVDRADLFNIGDLIDVVTLPATIAVAGRTITAIDLTAGANTVTISGANITSIVGQIITRTGSGPVSAVLNREMTGLGAIVGNAALYGIDPAVEPVWQSVINANGGTPRAVSEGLMTRMADDIFTNGGKTTVIFTSLGVRRAYANLLATQRQIVNTKEFTGGFTGIGFVTDRGEIPIVVDKDAPRGQMQFVNEDELKLYRAGGWEFMDYDGSKWDRVVTAAGKFDAYDCTLFQYHELGTHRRNTHGRLSDLIEE